MDYTFKIDDNRLFNISQSDNMTFGVNVGNSGNNILPDNAVTSNSVTCVEAVTQQWYDTNQHDKDVLYIIKGRG
ncbi:MAG: hypothetical protein K2O29_08065 [Ruminococcus sp.]|nr:hypothetical protein [Ruminococcus sp.]MDE7138393.1 hypothetical protein [Ruminococcus sp.]